MIVVEHLAETCDLKSSVEDMRLSANPGVGAGFHGSNGCRATLWMTTCMVVGVLVGDDEGAGS